MKVVSFVEIANVTHVQTLCGRIINSFRLIPTKFDRLLVLVIKKKHAKFQICRSNGLKVIALRNSEEFSHFCTCKTLHARRARILHHIRLNFCMVIVRLHINEHARFQK